MLDIEVVLVVEDRHRLAVVHGLASVLSALGRDGDGGEIDLLVHVGCLRRSSSHCVAICVARESCEVVCGLVVCSRKERRGVCFGEEPGKKIGALSMAGVKNRGAAAVGCSSKGEKKKLQWR